MTPHPAALEAYNRATFDPPTPELELAPAEEVQRDPVSIIRTIPKREIAGWFAVFGLLAVVAAGWAVVL
jgi:hypothetical protein